MTAWDQIARCAKAQTKGLRMPSLGTMRSVAIEQGDGDLEAVARTAGALRPNLVVFTGAAYLLGLTLKDDMLPLRIRREAGEL